MSNLINAMLQSVLGNPSARKQPKDKNYWIDLCGLWILGIFSLGYILFLKRLAERNIQLPFLDFPIFVGEILLFVCLLLFIAKYRNNSQRLTKWHYLIIGYFVFVIIKAVYGYWKWGPLAFRHAALFYYLAFAVFGYAFFRKDFFNWEKACMLFILICIIFFIRHSEHWTLTLTFLGFILVKFFPGRLKYLMLTVLLIIIPYKEFFQTARMMIVSNLLSGVYLAGILPFILEGPKKVKFALAALIGGVVLIGLLKFADYGAVKSILDFKKMAGVIKECDDYIKSRSDGFVMEERKQIKVYNPDQELQKYSDEPKKEAVQVPVQEEPPKTNVQVEPIKVESIVSDQLPQNVPENIPPNVSENLPENVPTKGVPIKVEVQPAQDKLLQNENDVEETETIKKIRQMFKGAPVKRINDEKRSDAAPLKTSTEKTRLLEVIVDPAPAEAEEVQEQPAEQTHPADPVKGSGWVDNNNAVFRLLIWRDMWREMLANVTVWPLGFDFGKPFRSKSLEILVWGQGDWARDGWIAAHNSYWEIIYRMGMIGILLILCLWGLLFKMMKKFILTKLFTGVLLCGIILNWFVAANFLVVFELPFTAIPIWTIYGMILAYAYKTEEGKEGNNALAK